jgi:hypothetical protein
MNVHLNSVCLTLALVAQELFSKQRSGELWFKVSPGKYFVTPYLENFLTKKGLVECLMW